MNDLTFYTSRNEGAKYVRNSQYSDVWTWLPTHRVLPANLSSNSILIEAGWERAGIYREIEGALIALCNQLSDICLVTPPGADVPNMELWTPSADIRRVEQLPVVLAFTVSPAQAHQAEGFYLKTRQALPPTNFGELGMIAVAENADSSTWHWIRGKITRLPDESHQLQQRMGAALSRLASASNLERAAWLKQWEEIQAMARQLAADYWRAYQDGQVERPRPINIWTMHQNGQASTLAPLTMIQDGAHASIYHKDKWEQEHMLEEGPHSGLKLPRYIHTSKSTQTEYWLQHPEELEAPIDPDLVSQEVLKQQTKLDDMEADLLMLAPIYLLATQQKEFYLAPEQLLKDLDFTPKQKGGYSAGYQPDELKRVIDAFERLAWLRIKTRQSIQKSRGRKPALITAEAPYLIITEWIWQEPLDESGPRRFVGWKYEITWLEKFTGGTEAGKQLGQLLKKSFAYSQKQRWEKRLARYLTIHLNVAAHDHQKGIDCNIRRVLEHCGLAPTERDKAHPDEYASQFESAMNRLKRDGIIGDWLPKIGRASLPPRAWLDLWLDSSFHVTQAPTALEAGYQKMIDMRQPHKKRE